MADKAATYRPLLTNAALTTTYQRLVEMFDRHQVQATFAFVGAFTLSPDEFEANRESFEHVGSATRQWVAPFLSDAQARRFDGWLNPAAIAVVEASGSHEIASHGFTHVPLHEGSVTQGEFDQEMRSILSLPRFAQQPLKTFVYPRNMIGHSDRLFEAGFVGYRDNIEKVKHVRRGQLASLLEELSPVQRSQPHLVDSRTPVIIPAGRFLNWRTGKRRLIPPSLTVQNWQALIEHAVRTGGVAHIWTHPHNFLTGDDAMFPVFDAILEYAAERVRRGELVNLTKRSYVRSLIDTPEVRRSA